MSDSLSVSSSYSSSASSSNSNSLNRSLFANSSSLSSQMSKSKQLLSNGSSTSTTSGSARSSRLDESSRLCETPPRHRRTRSHHCILFTDESEMINRYNKQLLEDLYILKRQLKQRDETIEKLNDIRNKLENEIQELSASLFEQAYSMVNTAKAETAQYEKLLKEANGKIDVLQAEVKALKEVVLTSTPTKHMMNSSSNLTINNNTNNHALNTTKSHSRQSSLNQQSLVHLTQLSTSASSNALMSNGINSSLNTPLNLPQTSTPTNQAVKEKSSFFSKSHKRVPSHNDIQGKVSLIDKLFQSSSSSLNNVPKNQYLQSPEVVIDSSTNEFDPIYFKELIEWKQNPDLKSKSCAFMRRVFDQDILPCLNFENNNDKAKILDELLDSIVSNSVCIEDLATSSTSSTSVTTNENALQSCGLSNIQSVCQYKIKLSENSQWIYISRLSRNRVISVCDFYNYLRYIKDGLVKSDVYEIYWNIIDLRKKICLSRLGL